MLFGFNDVPQYVKDVSEDRCAHRTRVYILNFNRQHTNSFRYTTTFYLQVLLKET